MMTPELYFLTFRMPRNIVEDEGERRDFIDKCRKNDLRVICVLTEPEEFEKYSGESGLLDFYRDECGLTVYNRAIPDFQIPIHGDLVNNIIDLTYHLSQVTLCDKVNFVRLKLYQFISGDVGDNHFLR